ncbi:MAG: SDR family NAD(P)-dependent oxidoreductase [Spirochaetales bacterium]|nr:SDR family NAD(P)-dependent oxidoreductase [Spirochaetales bacterium]
MNHKSVQDNKQVLEGIKKEHIQLPNGLFIAHQNKYETEFVYNEIFVEKVYTKNGITINPGDCVFDVGANIGLFSLFVLNQYGNIKVVAIEPSPELNDIIRFNTKEYENNIAILQCGVSDKEGESIFTFYPDYSIISGFNADYASDYEILKDGILSSNSLNNDFEENCLNEIIKNKLSNKIEYKCKIKTISDIMAESDVAIIDLLKIDAEKHELNILKGIKDRDWPKIKQIVMELHKLPDESIKEVERLLHGKGFSTKMEKEKNLSHSGIINLYALRSHSPDDIRINKMSDIGISSEKTPDRTKDKNIQLTISATFTAEPLRDGLEFWEKELDTPIDIQFAPYNQVFQELLDPFSVFTRNSNGMNVIILKFDDWLRYYQANKDDKGVMVKNNENISQLKSYLWSVFNDLIMALQSYSGRQGCYMLLLLCPASPEYEQNTSIKKLFRKMETKLVQHIKKLGAIDLINARDYHKYYGIVNIFDPMGNEMGHIPYFPEYYHFLSTLIFRRLYIIKNAPYKVIALDCDNTLWEGVCGEDGPQGVKIKGWYRTFQQFLVKKHNEGLLLCLCSKNNPKDIWDVYDEQNSMPLKKEHIIESRINWLPKSQNIHSLADSLNLGAGAFFLFDDNPVECAEVNENNPGVFTLHWPEVKNRKYFLEHIWMLDNYAVTDEDKNRHESYRANIKREEFKTSCYSFEEYIENLKLDIKINLLTEAKIARVSQLTSRTNQFNFSTTRRSPAEITHLLKDETCECWTVDVSDRFGDYGTVGVMITKITGKDLVLDTLLLSCRVLGRGVEYRMMAWLGADAKKKKLQNLKGIFIKTQRNQPAWLFLKHIAKKHITTHENDKTEFIIPAAALLEVAFKPSENMSDQAVPQKRKNHEKQAQLSFSHVRKKEKFLTRIIELGDSDRLSKEINLYLHNKSGDMKIEKGNTHEISIHLSDTLHYAMILDKVKDIFSRVLLLSKANLNEDEEIDTYIARNSLKIVEITSALHREFNNVIPTLLFEHKTMRSIIDWLINNKNDSTQNTQKIQKIDESGLSTRTGKASGNDIAIIGINGRFPLAADTAEFWNNLVNGRYSIYEVPGDRWNSGFYYDKTGKPGKSYCKWGGFLDAIDRFDAAFFNISPREAELMDPQQRLFLEVVWGLLEDAGYTPDTFDRDTGVFVGLIASDYNTLTNQAAIQGESAYRNSDFYQIPNRISYFFDFHGPSITVDTACSSAGTALHLACRSIRENDCAAAIVGGINLFIHPSRFIQYSQMQVLSRDNIIRPFGENATGTLYGEGVGAILLKPLQAAERDGDYIYAVIKGSAINSGGKTNGFTVPSPLAQKELIVKALHNSKIDPRTMSYIEAHGTGTSLGDPIELRGLTEAYKENMNLTAHKNDTQFCAIGSVKSNIGHLESAAAIAGIIKVLLQMKHGLLVPSLNAGKLNPLIPFDQTPFFVQQRVSRWERPTLNVEGKPVTFPLRAGISSFGAGGVNTHFILEEYERIPDKETDDNVYILVFSNRNRENLILYLKVFINFLKHVQSNSINIKLCDIAYTLQTGRVAMQERLALIAGNIDEMIVKLTGFCHGTTTGERIYAGNINNKRAGTRVLPEEKINSAYVQELVAANKHDTLAVRWIQGIEIDWDILYRNKHPGRVPLPTYRFSGEKYWITGKCKPETDESADNKSDRLHSMIDCNVSNLYEQCFKKSLSRHDLFVGDHIINGQMILPGAAYFEMARIAGTVSLQGKQINTLKNIVWIRPVIVNETAKELFISLKPGENSIKCCARTGHNNDHAIIHAEWEMEPENGIQTAKKNDTILIPIIGTEQSGERFNINNMKERSEGVIGKSECYRLLKSIGYEYGKSYQVIKELYYTQDMAISILELQGEISHDVVLSPALLDGSLQTVTVWKSKLRGVPAQPYIPFTIGEVELHKPLTPVCYAIATNAAGNSASLTDMTKYDIRIIDEDGNILVGIKDYFSRPFPQKHETGMSATLNKISRKIYFTCQWEEVPLPENGPGWNPATACIIFAPGDEILPCIHKMLHLQQTGIVLVKPGKEFLDCGDMRYEINPGVEEDYIKLLLSLKDKKFTPDTVLHLWSQAADTIDPDKIGEQLDQGLFSIQFLCKALLGGVTTGEVKIIYTYFNHTNIHQPQFASLGGLVQSIQRENPRLSFKVLEIRCKGVFSDKFYEIIINESINPWQGVIEIRYASLQQRFIKKVKTGDFADIIQARDLNSENASTLKENGVYLITGGSGGLGFIFARYITRKMKVKLVLTGRSDLNEEKRRKINQLESLGAEVSYLKSDISKHKAVKRLISRIKARYRQLNGIIHCAGVIRDSLVINKSREDSEAVIASKVWGTLFLDDVLKSEKLDFFILFSSTSSIIGHIGQSDYSFANRFLDDFVLYREMMRENNTRSGRTISINWPWWQQGGMKLDDYSVRHLENLYGFKGMDTESGLDVFEKVLEEQVSNIGIIIGEPGKIVALFQENKDHTQGKRNGCPGISTDNTIEPGEEDSIVRQVKKDLSLDISEILKLLPEKISAGEKFSSFGFDSITFTHFANRINERYNSTISPAVFYEYQTLHDFSFFLYQENNQKVTAYYNKFDKIKHRQSDIENKKTGTIIMNAASNRFIPQITASHQTSENNFKQEIDEVSENRKHVAIIGIGGKFPQSETLADFWQHLVNEKDMITEIPENRWNWKQYYGDPKSGTDKTDVKWGGFIKDVDKFDARFFSISPREAAYMDPQQRLFLETVWSALEDSGYNPDELSGTNTGLFVGASLNDYNELMKDYGLSINPFISSGINNSIIANRISYLLNIHGPSEVIDTACSSSLVAIKHAVDCIRNGECSLAIAGGVNIILRPKFHISFRLTGMLSPDGRCKTFDEKANGYVRGEGVGAIILKSLKQAEADRDTIYAIILGVAENHGGQTQSLTAPNPRAQSELLLKAYKDARISLNTVSYIEAHGTGTAIGDPIEVNGLKEAYAKMDANAESDRPAKPFCGLGSVKTNIGHLEAGGGIAGVIKVLLAFKHSVLPASLHFNSLNPYINLDNTPFYVVHKTRAWEPLKNSQGDIIPRRAGISAFGFGGTNAHLVLEEYHKNYYRASTNVEEYQSKKENPGFPGNRMRIIVLSAANTERLHEYVKVFHDYLESTNNDELSICDIAYTLQVGRKPMNERAAMVVGDVEGLNQLLASFCEGNRDNDSIVTGRVDAENIRDDGLLKINDLMNMDRYEQKAALVEIALAWIKGITVDWTLLYQDEQPKRVPLPTYPFAKESHWLPGKFMDNHSDKERKKLTAMMHPLLDENKTNLKQIRFTKLFTGTEFYLSDHLIEGRKVLPGVVYLEMARAAGELALEKKIISIRNIVWAQPIIVDEIPQDIHTVLYPDGDSLKYEVKSLAPHDEGQSIYARGKLIFNKNNDTRLNDEYIDISLIKNRLTHILTGEQFYRSFDIDGSRYLHRFQSVQKLLYDKQESLSMVELPAGLEAEFKDYILHPALMDGALQTIIGLKTEEQRKNEAPFLPFTIGEIDLLHPLTSICYAYTTISASAHGSLPEVMYYDILITDRKGKVLLKIKDYCVRSLKGKMVKKPDIAAHADETVYYYKKWRSNPFDNKHSKTINHVCRDNVPNPATIMVWDIDNDVYNALKHTLSMSCSSDSHLIRILPGDNFNNQSSDSYQLNPGKTEHIKQLIDDLQQKRLVPDYIIWNIRHDLDYEASLFSDTVLDKVIYPLFNLNRELIRYNPARQIKCIYIYPVNSDMNNTNNAENIIFESLTGALNGLARSVFLENLKIRFKTVEVSIPDENGHYPEPAGLAGLICDELFTGGEGEVRYSNNHRYTMELNEIDPDTLIKALNSGPLFRQQGVYVISGGTGSLGRIVANYLAENYRAKLIVTGRTPLNNNREEFVRALEKSGAEICYLQSDISNLDDVKILINKSLARFGKINGIIHCAGIINDSLLINKDPENIKQVIAPKVRGTIYLDMLTKELDLDLFVLFSSLSALAGNIGQSDYAYANSFMDHFAQLRENLRRNNQRYGKTIAIGWPYWREGGMKVHPENEKFLASTTGMKPLDTQTGLTIFEKSVSLPYSWIGVMKGESKKIRNWVTSLTGNTEIMQNKNIIENEGYDNANSYMARFESDMRTIFAELLQLSINKINLKDDLSKLGMSSILFVELANRINEKYGMEIIPSVFFSYSTIASVVLFLFQGYSEKITGYYINTVDEESANFLNTPAGTPGTTGFSPAENKMHDVTPMPNINNEPVAIIGLDALMPASGDLDEFWENLEKGVDMVSRIPAERWNAMGYRQQKVEDPIDICAAWGGFITDIDKFDAGFFNISRKEAEYMDPQHRLFLETVWKAIEDAGYSPGDMAGTRAGVYAGVANSDYYDVVRDSGKGMDAYAITGREHSILANRISYLLNLHGPSEPVNTACSSSLVAIHRACEALRSGKCHLAIAGGVNVLISRAYYHSVSDAGMLSRDGRCKTFDKDAHGYVRSEGCAVLVLKLLSSAIIDRDHIYGIIRGSCVNHNGRTSSLTAPSADSQAELLIETYSSANVDPGTISYIETHGTGTELGDPIEIESLKKAFHELQKRQGTQGNNKVHIGLGSVKTATGHLESASGMAGIIKVLLSMKNKVIPGNIHLREVNPYIKLDDSPFYLVKDTIQWERLKDDSNNPIPRRAGVSSFGFGGVNAHMIIEEYEETGPRHNNTVHVPQVIILSAKNDARLKEYARKLLQYLENKRARNTNNALPDIRDIAYTLQTGRDTMPSRLACIVSDVPELVEMLHQYCSGQADIKYLYTGNVKTTEKISEDIINMGMLIKKQDMALLAKLWVSGAEIDWMLFYHTDKPRRLSLPTYPFARERYWIDTNTHTQRQEVMTQCVDETINSPDQINYYRTEWINKRIDPGLDPEKNNSNRNILILIDNAGVRETILNCIGKKAGPGNNFVFVSKGEKYNKINQNVFEINPVHVQDYQTLFQALEQSGMFPDTIFHAWSEGIFCQDMESLKREIESGLFSLFYIIQNLTIKKIKRTVSLLFIYSSENGSTQPHYEAVSGFMKSVQRENNCLECKTVEIQNPSGKLEDINPEWFIESMLRELEVYDGPQVRYGESTRQVKLLYKHKWEDTSHNTGTTLVKEKGVYLITGGLGGLGIIFAQYLARKAEIRLVLSGRSVLNDEKVKKINELKELGMDVMYLQSDISCPRQTGQLIRDVKQLCGGINGIIHCAGIIRDGFLINKSVQSLQEVINPKVFGAINLANAIKDEKVDFFVMFSSIASVFGFAGQCDYAYANAFLDSFAYINGKTGAINKGKCKTISINWPYWGDGGMKIPDEELELLCTQTGFRPIPGDLGLEMFERCMQSGSCHCIITYGNQDKIDQYMSQLLYKDESLQNKQFESSKNISLQEINDEIICKKTEQYLKNIFSKLLSVDEGDITADSSFEEYGIDSIIINKFNNHIEDSLCNLPRTLLFEYRNIEELVEYFVQNHKEKLIRLFEDRESTGKKDIHFIDDHIKNSTVIKQDKPSSEIHKQNAGEWETENDIAIIGMSGIYPGANDLDEFWSNLKTGKDCITEIPGNRWDYHLYYHPDKDMANQGKIYCKWGGFIDDADKFDAPLFGISPREAGAIDPQERLFLQSVWAALEDAGYAGQIFDWYRNKSNYTDIGVFVGTTTNTYPYIGIEKWNQHLEKQQSGFNRVEEHSTLIHFAHPWSIANRVSFYFGFHGPSMPVNTACSSSLSAFYLACESIKRGECSMAIAGGVNLFLHPFKYLEMCSARMLSPSGKCFSFGDRADGFVPGEGIGAVLLKPLSRAIKDNDNIYGIYKGGAINHGGRTNGYTVPNPAAQAAVIAMAVKNADIDPSTISYIEAHGTGTELGDPIEIEGLSRIFRKYNDRRQYCSIGSVKSNIGHLESAAGIAGITKILLQMRHKQLVPSLHARTLNPKIDFESSPFFVQRNLSEWKQPVKLENGRQIPYPRRSGISSFGAGGSNVHIIFEEYSGYNDNSPAEIHIKTGNQRRYLIPLSAVDEDCLLLYAGKLAGWLENYLDSSVQGVSTDTVRHKPGFSLTLHDIAHTLQVGRVSLEVRLALLVSSIDELVKLLKQYSEGYLEKQQLGFNCVEEHLINDNRASTNVEERISNGTIFTGRVRKIKRNKNNPIVKVNEIIQSEGSRGMETLALLWVKGAEIDWKLLYQDPYPGKISLPTYQFKKESYWLDSHCIDFPAKNNSDVKGIEDMDSTGELGKGHLNNQTTEQPKIISENNTDKAEIKNQRLLSKSLEKKQMISEDTIKAKIKELLAKVLFMQPQTVDENKQFVDLGLDSVLGVEFINKLNKIYNTSIEASKLYDYSTAVELAKYAVDLVNKDLYEINNNEQVLSPGNNKEIKADPASCTPASYTKVKSDHEEPAGIPKLKLKNQFTIAKNNQGKNQAREEFSGFKNGPDNHDDIAIIGMSARLPGAADTWELWDILTKGICTVREVPSERWSIDEHYNPDTTVKNKSYCKYGGYLSDIDKFDPLFFNISPREAKLIEPQQRLFLQEAWRAFENAGYSSEALANMRCGVYVGVGSINEYNPLYMFNTSSILAARISYFLDLKGPAVSIDTACSSSLVAIHMACRSLIHNEADMMLAGGVTIFLTEKLYIQMCQAGMLSPDGKCKSFDNEANGFVPAEGAGVLVLKRYEKAVLDGDYIYGVIKGIGMNQDGRTNGIAAPSSVSQKELEIEVYEKNGINPETITLVEAHGTGTSLGDPLEFEALKGSFQRFTNKKQYCALGSLKSNLGHTAAAAGVAGIIKVLLAMKYRKIPATLHYKTPNKQIDVTNSPFYMNTSLKDWKTAPDVPLRGTVSAFGLSGTNAHVVLEQVNNNINQTRQRTMPYYIIPLSAKTDESLAQKTKDMAKWIELEGTGHFISDVSFTLFLGRSHFQLRIALVVKDMIDLKNQLEKLITDGIPGDILSGKLVNENNASTPLFLQLGKTLIQQLKNGMDLEKSEVKEKLLALADFYNRGGNLEWKDLFTDQECSRIPLPMYPFVKKSYWTRGTEQAEEHKVRGMEKKRRNHMEQIKKADPYTKEKTVKILLDVFAKKI